MFKRLLSLLVTVTMLVSLIPASVFAEGDAVVTDTVEQVVVQPEPEKEEPKQEEKEPETPTEEPKETEAPAEEPVETEAPVEEPVEEEPVEEEPAQEELLENELLDDAEDPMAALTELQKAFAVAANTVGKVETITWDHFGITEDALKAYKAVIEAGQDVTVFDTVADTVNQKSYKDYVDDAVAALAIIYQTAYEATSEKDIWKDQAVFKAFIPMMSQMDGSYVYAAAYNLETGPYPPFIGPTLTNAAKTYEDAQAYITVDGVDVDYETLQAALNAVEGGQTIVVKNNIDALETITASKDVAYTINTNGKNIKFDNVAATANVSAWTITAGNVTLNGGGSVTCKEHSYVKHLIKTQNVGTSLTIDGDVKVRIELTSNTNCTALRVEAGSKLALNSGSIYAHNTPTTTGKDPLSNGIHVIGSATNDAVLTSKEGSNFVLEGDYGVFAASYSDVQLQDMTINGYWGALSGSGLELCSEATIKNCTLTAQKNIGSIGLYFPSTTSLTVSGCTIDADSGVEVKGGTVTIEETIIKATGSPDGTNYLPTGGTSCGGDGVVLVGRPSYAATTTEVKLILNKVKITSEKQNAVVVYRENGDTKKLTVTITNCELNADKTNYHAIYVNNLITTDDLANITIANSETAPALEAGNYTLAQGQKLITIDGNKSVVAASMEAALNSQGTITLGADYVDETEAIVIPEGKTLNANARAVTAASVTVNGALVGDINALTTMATVNAGGSFTKGGVVIIGNDENAIFTLSEGATMTAVKSGDGIAYAVTAGVVTINNTFGEGTVFTMTGNDTLTIASEADVTLADELSLGDTTGITGTIKMNVAKIGDVNYTSLQDALDNVQSGDEIVLLRDIDISEDITASVDAEYTIEATGKNIKVTASGSPSIQVWGLTFNAGVVTIKGGNFTADDVQIRSLIRTMDAANVTLDGVTMTSTNGYTSGKMCAALRVSAGGVLTVTNNSKITAHDSGSDDLSGIVVQGGTTTAGVAANGTVYVKQGSEIDADCGIFALKNSYTEVENATIKGVLSGIMGNGTQADSEVKVSNSTIEVTSTESGIGIYSPSTKGVEVVKSTITALSGIEIKNGTLTVTESEINATGYKESPDYNSSEGTSGGGNGVVVIANKSYLPDESTSSGIEVLLDNVTVNSTKQNAVVVHRATDAQKPIKVTIQNSKLNAPAANMKAIYATSGCTDTDIANITIANSETAPALEAGNYTLAQGQKLITIDGNKSIVAESIEKAFTTERTTIKLGADYTSDAEEVIPEGATLDANGFIVDVKLTVKGKLISTNNGALTKGATVVNGGELTIGGELLIANTVSEGSKPVFGLTTGATMTAIKNEDATNYTAESGNTYIQRGFGESVTTFSMQNGDKLYIPTTLGAGRVWLTDGVTLGSKSGIFGRISVAMAKIVRDGVDVVYSIIDDAIADCQEGETIVITTNLTGDYAITEPVVIDKDVTIDLAEKTIDFELSDSVKTGLDIIGATVTIKNGTLNAAVDAAANDEGNVDEFQGKIALILATEGANVTLDNVNAKLTGGAHGKAGKTIRVNGATVTAVNGTTIYSQRRAVLVEEDGTFNATGGSIEAGSSLSIKALGKSGQVATVNLTGVEVTNAVQPASYSNVTMKNTNVTGAYGAIYGNGTERHARVTVEGGTLKVTGNTSYDNCAVYMASTEYLYMKDTTIIADNVGIEIRGGTSTLENVNITAGANRKSTPNYDNNQGSAPSGYGDALVVTAINPYGRVIEDGVVKNSKEINVTVIGGSYTSTSGSAIAYGYVGDAKTNADNPKELIITVSDATLTGKTGAIYNHNAAVPETVTVSDINTNPQLDKDNITLADGQVLINIECEKDNVKEYGTITRAKLSDAINARRDGYAMITLPMSYTNRKDDIVATSDMSLFVSGEGTVLDVNSLKIYHQVSMFEGTSLRANELEAIRNPDYSEGGLLNLRNIGQLLGNTTVVVKSNVDENGTMGSGMLSIGGKFVISSQTGGYAGLFKPGNGAEMHVSAMNVGTAKAPQYVAKYEVIAGEVVIANNGNATFAMGDDYLDIAKGTIVTLADGVGIGSMDHITGEITMPDVAALLEIMKKLPADAEDLTYSDYDAVKAAIAAKTTVANNNHTAAAKAECELVDAFEALYLIKYIETYPNMFDLTFDNTNVEIGGDARKYTITQVTDLPKDVLALVNTDFEIVQTWETVGNFDIDQTEKTIKANADTKTGDTARLSVELKQKNGTRKSMDVETVSFRAVPNSTDIPMSEIVLDSYNEVVNLQYTSQEVVIPVQYAFSNGLSYGLNGYTIVSTEWAEADTKNKTPINSVYKDPVHEEGKITLVPNGTGLLKNKTYTGTILFTVKSPSDQDITLPATAVLSVKVTDVAPKVTVKLGTLDAFVNQYRATGIEEYPYAYTPVPVTFGGANVADIETISFDKDTDENVKYSYNEVDGTIEITSKEPIKKGTLKPVMTVKFTEESQFAPFDLAKTTKTGLAGTVALKVIETSPAIKLAKTSVTMTGSSNGAIGKTVDVYLVATNKKAPFDMSTITGVEARFIKGSGKNMTDTECDLVDAELADEDGTVTLTMKRAFDLTEKNYKVTLRFSFEGTKTTKDLALTINKKDLAIKLGKTSVDFNVKNDSNVAVVPITVTPESDTVTLARIGVKVGKVETFYDSDGNGNVNVDGMEFSCYDDTLLSIDADGVENLAKGNLKYNLYFEDVAKAVAFTVKVADKYQTVKLGKTSVSVNTTLDDFAIVPIVYSDGILDGSQVDWDENERVECEYNENEGVLTVSLKEDAQKSETLTFTIKDANTDPKKSTLKLTIKNVDKAVAMKAAVKGKLDTLTEDSTVVATITFSGTTGGYNMKTFAKDQGLDEHNFTLTPATSNDPDALEIKGSEYDAKGNLLLTIGWKSGMNLKGTGKYNVNLNMEDTDSGLDVKLAKAVAISAAVGKFKVTAQTATLHEALKLERVYLDLDAGVANINDVQLAKLSEFYEFGEDVNGYYIRYADEFAGFGKKWKAKDSVTLNVKVDGTANKVYTVKLPIVNIEKQAEDAQQTPAN